MKSTILAKLSLVLLLLMKMAAGDAITCTAVTTRLSTHVTCHFGFDVSKNKRDMNVQFFYPDMTVRAETPLMCSYDRTDNLKCLLGKDIIFDRKVSDHISFTRPSAVDKVGGQYVCQVAPPLANTDIVPCKLTFIDIPTEPPTIPELLPQGNDDDDSDHLGVVAVVFHLLIITAVIVVCVLFYIRRERIRQWCSGPIRQNWPGATGDPEKLETAVKASAIAEGGSQGEPLLAGDSPEDYVLQEIPQGLPQFFFKKGWTDGKARAEREMEAKNAQEQRQQKKAMQDPTVHEAGDQTQDPSLLQRFNPFSRSGNRDNTKNEKRYDEEDDSVNISRGNFPLQQLDASYPMVKEATEELGTAGQWGSQTESKEEKKAREKIEKKEKKERERKEKKEKEAEEALRKAEAKAAKQKK